MCCKLFFKRLSYNACCPEESHGKVAKSMAEFRWLSPRQKYIITVHTMGRVIGVLFTRHSDEFVKGASDVFILYDWMTGVLYTVSECMLRESRFH